MRVLISVLVTQVNRYQGGNKMSVSEMRELAAEVVRAREELATAEGRLQEAGARHQERLDASKRVENLFCASIEEGSLNRGAFIIETLPGGHSAPPGTQLVLKILTWDRTHHPRDGVFYNLKVFDSPVDGTPDWPSGAFIDAEGIDTPERQAELAEKMGGRISPKTVRVIETTVQNESRLDRALRLISLAVAGLNSVVDGTQGVGTLGPSIGWLEEAIHHVKKVRGR
jgi:hypothetical protein